MANGLYVKGKERLLGVATQINLSTDTIKIAMVTASYGGNLTTDEFYSSVVGFVVGTPATLASKQLTGGAFDAADVTFSAVSGGSTVSKLVIYKDTGSNSTSPLIALFDIGAGLPITTNGGDITISFDNGTNKIFKI